MGSVSRYEIGSDFVEPLLRIHQMYREEKKFSELDMLEKIKWVWGLLTSFATAGNGALALHDDRFYHKIDAGINAAGLVEVGIEGYQAVVCAETCDSGTIVSVVARVVRTACSILSILPLPPLIRDVFSMGKNAATVTIQVQQIFWKAFCADPRTDTSLPFSEKDEKNFCQWAACFKNTKVFLCSISNRFIRRPAAYPERVVTVDLDSVEELKQRNVVEVRIKKKIYIVAHFSEAFGETKKKADFAYQTCRRLYSQSIHFRNGLKRCVDKGTFSEDPADLLKEYSAHLLSCPITKKAIRSLALPSNDRSIHYERSAIFGVLKNTPNKPPPQWPDSIPFSRRNIIVSGAECEKYEAIVQKLFGELRSSLNVIDGSGLSLRERFQYFLNYYFLKGVSNNK